VNLISHLSVPLFTRHVISRTTRLPMYNFIQPTSYMHMISRKPTRACHVTVSAVLSRLLPLAETSEGSSLLLLQMQAFKRASRPSKIPAFAFEQ
jgi:hypothetical protein